MGPRMSRIGNATWMHGVAALSASISAYLVPGGQGTAERRLSHCSKSLCKLVQHQHLQTSHWWCVAKHHIRANTKPPKIQCLALTPQRYSCLWRFHFVRIGNATCIRSVTAPSASISAYLVPGGQGTAERRLSHCSKSLCKLVQHQHLQTSHWWCVAEHHVLTNTKSLKIQSLALTPQRYSCLWHFHFPSVVRHRS
jgi:hypothetical protein